MKFYLHTNSVHDVVKVLNNLHVFSKQPEFEYQRRARRLFALVDRVAHHPRCTTFSYRSCSLCSISLQTMHPPTLFENFSCIATQIEPINWVFGEVLPEVGVSFHWLKHSCRI